MSLTREQEQSLRAALEKLPPETKEAHAWQEICGGQPSVETLQHALQLRRTPVLREMLAKLDQALAENPDLGKLAPLQLFQRVWPEAVRRDDFRDLYVRVKLARQKQAAIKAED